MIRPVNRLAGWQRRTLYVSGILLLLTGVLWLAVHYSVGAGTGELPHPIEAWSMQLHGLAAFTGIFVVGVLSAAHIPRGWWHGRQHRWASQRKTGLALCILAGVLIVTGYMLYYFAPEPIRPTLGWVHAVAGIAMAVLIFIHQQNKSATPSSGTIR